MEELQTDIHLEEGEKPKLKGLKISEEAKKRLKLTKQPGETFSETVMRLVDVNLAYKRANMANITGDMVNNTANVANPETEKGDVKMFKDTKSLAEGVRVFFDEVGVPPVVLLDAWKGHMKNENLKLRRPYGKPLNLTTIIKTFIWVAGGVIAFIMSLPVIRVLIEELV